MGCKGSLVCRVAARTEIRVSLFDSRPPPTIAPEAFGAAIVPLDGEKVIEGGFSAPSPLCRVTDEDRAEFLDSPSFSLDVIKPSCRASRACGRVASASRPQGRMASYREL